MAPYAAGKGSFDVMVEASGNEAALNTGLATLKPRGILVQLGLGGQFSVPQNMIVTKEIEVRGSFRFDKEFALAAALIGSRRADVRPLLTQVFPFRDAVEAFAVASDRRRAMKVQLSFDGVALAG